MIIITIATGLAATVAIALSLLTGPAVAHGGLNNYTVGDTWYRGFDPNEPAEEQLSQDWLVQRPWYTIDPVFSVDDPSLACNTPGTAAVSSIPISAGENITALYYFWLHPVGPMTAWLSPCPPQADGGCGSVDAKDASWFKIWEGGLLDGDLTSGTWYQKGFQKWDGEPAEWPVTIPWNLKPGNYLIRHEIISIHVANKPQFYPECAHLNIAPPNGAAVEEIDGGVLPPEDGDWYKQFPGEYSMDDPQINIDIYTDEAMKTMNYTIPGGTIWQGFEF